MGWTSFPMYRKPSLQELERLADEEFNGPNTTIIGRSSWTNWNTRRFTLFQHTSPERPGPNILIAVTLAEYRDRELFRRTMDETEGPLVYNCPLKLLKQAEQSPPQNEYSANWRAKVHKFHQRQRDLDKLLNQLFTQYPNGNRQLVVNGASVLYYPARKKGRTIHAYQNPGTTTLYRINRDDIDIEQTLEIHTAKNATPALRENSSA